MFFVTSENGANEFFNSGRIHCWQRARIRKEEAIN
jgi:hypothetical protein